MEKQLALPHHKHVFSKINLVTKSNKKGTFDEFQCELCGLTGKRYGLSNSVSVEYTDDRVFKCDGAAVLDRYVGEWLCITQCNCQGIQFAEMTPDSVHKVVTPPKGYFNGDRGVWVKGKSEPVKLLFGEYIMEPSEYERTK